MDDVVKDDKFEFILRPREVVLVGIDITRVKSFWEASCPDTLTPYHLVNIIPDRFPSEVLDFFVLLVHKSQELFTAVLVVEGAVSGVLAISYRSEPRELIQIGAGLGFS